MGNRLVKSILNMKACLTGPEFNQQDCEDEDRLAQQYDEFKEDNKAMMQWMKMLTVPVIVLVILLVLCCFGLCCMGACCFMTSERGILGRLMEMKYSAPIVKKRKAKVDVEKARKEGIRDSELYI